MYVSHLSLNDYRSYRSEVVELPASAVVFEGGNGRGKTNLVEALAYLATFSSHRVSSSNALVRVARSGEEQPGGAVIRARVQYGEKSTLLELEIARGRANRGRVNKANVPPRDLLGHLRTVVFAPEDLELLRGDPGQRRRFLDEMITKIKPHYLGVRQDFERVLKQRAAALKQLGRPGHHLSPEDEALLEIWDASLAELSAVIVAHRRAVVTALQPLVKDAYAKITEGDREAHISYDSHLAKKGFSVGEMTGMVVDSGRLLSGQAEEVEALTQTYIESLQRLRSQELRRGVNLEGAHRDDLVVTLDDLPVKGFASHGEMWSSALMLRLGELQLLRLDGDYPVLVLDDVFAELDTTRREGLLAQIKDVEQVLVTVAVGTNVPEELHAKKFLVERGADGFSTVIDAATAEEVAQEVGEGGDVSE